MTPMKPWTTRMWAMVEKGPQPYDKLLTECAALVPPGRAARTTERKLVWGRQKQHRENPRVSRDERREAESRLRNGARDIARASIWSATKNGKLLDYQEDGVRMIRKAPKQPAGDSLST